MLFDLSSVVMIAPTLAGIDWDEARTSMLSLRERASSIIEWYNEKSSVARAILFL
jgi:hypothetical protein